MGGAFEPLDEGGDFGEDETFDLPIDEFHSAPGEVGGEVLFAGGGTVHDFGALVGVEEG